METAAKLSKFSLKLSQLRVLCLTSTTKVLIPLESALCLQSIRLSSSEWRQTRCCNIRSLAGRKTPCLARCCSKGKEYCTGVPLENCLKTLDKHLLVECLTLWLNPMAYFILQVPSLINPATTQGMYVMMTICRTAIFIIEIVQYTMGYVTFDNILEMMWIITCSTDDLTKNSEMF